MRKLLVALMLCAPLFAQVTVDNAGKAAGATSGTTISITTFAVGSGSNRFLLCGVSYWTSTGISVSTVKFNTTTNLSSLGTGASIAQSPGTRKTEVWGVVNPPNVTATVVVTFSGTIEEAVAGCTSWSGVDQSTPIANLTNATGASGAPTVTVPSRGANDVTHDVLSWDRTAGSPTATGTQRWKTQSSTTTTGGGGQTKAAGTSVTMNWTGISANWATTGFNIKAYVAPATTMVPRKRAM